MIFIRPQKSKSKRRGMTIVEMAISVGIFAVINIGIAGVLLATARSNRDNFFYIRTESRARIAMDFIRKQVMVAEFGSLTITNNDRTIEFLDPNLGTESQMTFTGGALLFREDKTGGVTNRIGNLSDVVFALEQNGIILRYSVTTNATNSFGNDRDITLTEEVLLRNLPAN